MTSVLAQRSLLRVWVVVALCAALAVVVIWRYFSHPTLTLSDGEVVRDFSVAEVGALADPRFADARRTYFENLREYRKIPLTPIGDDLALTESRLRQSVGAALRQDPRNGDALRALSEDAEDSLYGTLALILHRAAGLEFDEYIRRGGFVRYQVPSSLDSRIYGDLVSGSDEQDPARVHEVFKETYEQANADEGVLIVSSAVVPEGFAIALALVSTDLRHDNPLLTRGMETGRERMFRGNLSKGMLVFGERGVPWNELREKRDAVVRCDFVVIVEDHGGDRYPLWSNLYFDPIARCWQIRMVSRQVSLPAAMSTPLAY